MATNKLTGTGDAGAYAPGSIANTGILQLVIDAEHLSTALVDALLEAVRSLDFRVRQLDNRRRASRSQDLRDVREQRVQLRKRRRRAKRHRKRARAEEIRATLLRQATRAARPSPDGSRRFLVTPLPLDASPRQCDDWLGLVSLGIDVNAGQLDDLSSRIPSVPRGTRLPVIPLGVAIAAVIAVAGVLYFSWPDGRESRDPPTTRPGESSVPRPEVTSAAPTGRPSESSPGAALAPGGQDERATAAYPAPMPASRGRRRTPPRPPPPPPRHRHSHRHRHQESPARRRSARPRRSRRSRRRRSSSPVVTATR